MTTTMADAFDRAVADRIAELERELAATARWLEAALIEISRAGEPLPAVRLRITGTHHPHRGATGGTG